MSPPFWMHTPGWKGAAVLGMQDWPALQPLLVTAAPPQASPAVAQTIGAMLGICTLGVHVPPVTTSGPVACTAWLQALVPVVQNMAIGCWGPQVTMLPGQPSLAYSQVPFQPAEGVCVPVQVLTLPHAASSTSMVEL